MRPKPRSTEKRFMLFVTGLSLVTMFTASSVFATTAAEFSVPILTPASQSTVAWTNVVPNALADYFTYTPHSTVDGNALGFPTGVCNVSADCYTITAKSTTQPMAYPGVFGGGPGLLDSTGATVSAVTVWAYGSGGAGWTPPGAAGPVTGNAPAVGPFTGGVWHFPAPTIRGTSGRPVYVQWLNEIPNTRPPGHDPSIDCGTASFCYPYNRLVTHVHGAHVTPESDGLTTAWYTPNFALFGEGKFADNLYAGTPGKPIYAYPMTQEAGTVWYHDHAIGTTHLNTNAGMAGFFTVTDANEQALITAGTLPDRKFESGFALQDRNFNEAGQIVMPDNGTYNKTTPGCTQDPVTGLDDPATCTRLHWMKQVGNPALTGAQDPSPSVRYIPYSAAAPEMTNPANPAYLLNNPAGCTVDLSNRFENITLAGAPFTQCAPFPATSSTLEYFGNMPVVNGVTYGTFDVEARVQRMRFLGGTDSRTWIMQLVKSTAVGTPTDCGTPVVTGGCMVYNPADILPFWQIGSELGLLDRPVRRDYIDLLAGERIDVLVDFTGITPGTTYILKNLGDDAPYSGTFDFESLATRQPTSVDIPEIMYFNVVGINTQVFPPAVIPNTLPNTALPSALAVAAGTPLRPTTSLVVPTATAGEPIRTVSLIEITDQYGRTMPTIDARGYVPPGMMVTENIKLGNTEIWDIVNTTVDAHPMHIHQVAFMALYRQAIASFDPPESNITTKVFSQPAYHAGGNPQIPVGAWDAGFKDTIQVIPGHVVRVIATWNLPGEYVWHCHILSHEEHDMMRPFQVVTASATAPPAYLGAQSNNGQGTVKLWWPAVAGATGYVIHSSTDGFLTAQYTVTTGNLVTNGLSSAILRNIADGTYTYRIAAVINGAQTSTYRTSASVVVAKTVDAPAWVRVSPKNSADGLVTVTWALSTTPATFDIHPEYGQLDFPVTYTVTATPTIGTPIVVSTDANDAPLTGSSAVLTLPAGTYTITVVANKESWKSSSATTGNTITAVKLLAPVGYVGAQVNNGTGIIKAWWPASPTAGASYTVTFTPTVGAPTVITGVAGTSYVNTTLPNETYTVSVVVDNVGWTSSSSVSSAPVTLTKVAKAPAYLGAQKGATVVKLWWPTIAGATMTIKENDVTVTPTILTSGTLSYVLLTGKSSGTYSYTIQNTTAGFVPSAVVNSSPVSLTFL